MKHFILIFIFICSKSNTMAQIKMDSFIGAGYSPFVEKDSSNVIISSEKWQHYKAFVGVSVTKHIFASIGMMAASVQGI